jgi:hypothetical protein
MCLCSVHTIGEETKKVIFGLSGIEPGATPRNLEVFDVHSTNPNTLRPIRIAQRKRLTFIYFLDEDLDELN